MLIDKKSDVAYILLNAEDSNKLAKSVWSFPAISVLTLWSSVSIRAAVSWLTGKTVVVFESGRQISTSRIKVSESFW